MNLQAQLTLLISGFTQGLNQANAQVQQFSNNLNNTLGRTDYLGPLQNSIRRTFTDFKQIVQGILLAQTFYQGFRLFKELASSVWEYTDALAYAQVTFSNLFKDGDKAERFISVLQDYAARSPFDFSDVEQAARQLSAYGIQAENMMFAVEGIGNLAAVTGQSETFERVSRAMGQIQAKGKLMGEEMRQLAEAGLNVGRVYELLGTSAQGLAKDNIDAATALNAIIDVLNSDYAGAMAAANTTLRGLVANTRDVFLMISSTLLEPLYEKIRNNIGFLSTILNEFRSAWQNSDSLGEAIEKVFGTDVYMVVMQLVGILGQLLNMLLAIGSIAGPIVAQIFSRMSTIFGTFLGILWQVVGSILGMLNAFMQTEEGARIVSIALWGIVSAMTAMRIATFLAATMQLFGNILRGVTATLAAVRAAITAVAIMQGVNSSATFLASVAWETFSRSLNLNPIVLAVTIVLTLVAAIMGLRAVLGSLGGASIMPKDFMPKIQSATGNVNEFNNRFGNLNDTLQETQDELGKTGKAAKKAIEGLLSFDEVFSLPEDKDNGINNTGTIDIPQPTFPDLSGISPGDFNLDDFEWEDMFPAITFPNFIDKFVEWFTNNWPKVLTMIAPMALMLFDQIAALFFGAIEKINIKGFLKKGLFSAIAGMIFTFLFSELADWMRANGLEGMAPWVDAFGNTFGMALGTLLITKNPIYAGVALFATSLMDSIGVALEGHQAPLEEKVMNVIGGALGGAAIGTMILPGWGTLIGAIVGAISTALINFWPEISEFFTVTIPNWWNNDVVPFFSQLWEDIVEGFTGWWGDVVNFFKGIPDAFTQFFYDIAYAIGFKLGEIIASFLSWIEEVKKFWTVDVPAAFMGWWDGVVVFWTTTVPTFFATLPEKISAWFNGVVKFWTEDVPALFTGWWDRIKTFWTVTVPEFFAKIPDFFKGWLEGIKKFWAEDVPEAILSFATGIADWFSGVAAWWGGLIESFLNGFKDGLGIHSPSTVFLEFGKNIIQGLINGVVEWFEKVKEFFFDFPNKFANFFKNAVKWLVVDGKNLIIGFWNGIIERIGGVWDWFREIPSKIWNYFTNAGTWIRNAGWNIINGFLGGLKDAWNNVTNFIGGIGDWIVRNKGPESYDKTLLTNAGRWIMGSLEDGLDEGFESVQKKVSKMGPTMEAKFKSSANSFQAQAVTEVQSQNIDYTQLLGTIIQAISDVELTTETTEETSPTGRPQVFVQTLIASRDSLRDLKRELDVVAAEDSRRAGGTQWVTA